MNATAVNAEPTINAGLEPNRYATRPATAPSTPMLRAAGSRYRLETTTEAPNPKPVLFGSCANCGKTMNDEYMPAPSRNAVRLVVQTPRIRIIAMSMSGSRLLLSTATQKAQTTRPATSRPSVRPDPQPQTVASLIASSTAVMPVLISAAASQLTRPGTRTGDSGTKRHVQIAATTITISGAQKSHCQLRCSTITAPLTIPNPAPMPRIADMSPMLPATWSGGNSSRTMPNASEKMPPATPCTTRARISSQSECDNAARSVPTASVPSVQRRTRSLPYMSPSRPRIAVPTDAESR